MNAPDVLYERPPLIEVICELRWRLQPFAAIPNLSFDPHYGLFSEDFSREIAAVGYSRIEHLEPIDLPIEFRSGSAVLRFRKRDNTWPLFQIGPGVMTINAVPPYEGWNDFRQVVQLGIKALSASYPVPERYLKIASLHLRYINAFDAEIGYMPHKKFLAEDLKIQAEISDEIVSRYVHRPDDIQATCHFSFDVKEHRATTGTIKVSPGQKNDNPAAILELGLQKQFDLPEAPEGESIARWFDESHGTIRDWFNITLSSRVKELMGPKNDGDQSR
jgi:uncharacterized protein (TIGR04255 family)